GVGKRLADARAVATQVHGQGHESPGGESRGGRGTRTAVGSEGMEQQDPTRDQRGRSLAGGAIAGTIERTEESLATGGREANLAGAGRDRLFAVRLHEAIQSLLNSALDPPGICPPPLPPEDPQPLAKSGARPPSLEVEVESDRYGLVALADGMVGVGEV